MLCIVLGVSSHIRRKIFQFINMAGLQQAHLDSNVYDRAPKNSLRQPLVQLCMLWWYLFILQIFIEHLPCARHGLASEMKQTKHSVSVLMQFAVILPPKQDPQKCFVSLRVSSEVKIDMTKTNLKHYPFKKSA